MQRRKQCSVKGSCSAVTKVCRSMHQTQSIFVSALPTSSRVSAGTRELREGRASSDRMRSNIASALSTTERGVEKDSQQRTANNVGRALRRTQSCLRLYDLRGASLHHQTCRPTLGPEQPKHFRGMAVQESSPDSVHCVPHWGGQVRSPRQQVLYPDAIMFAARTGSAASSSAIFSGPRVLIPHSRNPSTHVGHFRNCTIRRGRVLKSVIHQRQTEPQAKRRDSHRFPCTLN